MPILSERYALTNSPGTASAWPMHAAEIRQKLGLGTKLPDNTESLFFEIQGYKVTLLTPRMAAQMAGHSNKPHRIYAQCKMCQRELPFGRMVQHERACRKVAR